MRGISGTPTVVSTGIISSNPNTTACKPNEVSVVQPRRPRSAQEVSNKLSANMVSSQREICLLLWTPAAMRLAPQLKIKKAALSRDLLEHFRHSRCHDRIYLGVSVFGAAGFAAPVPVDG